MKQLSGIVTALVVCAMQVGAQKSGTTGPCGKDIACAELSIRDAFISPNIAGDSGALSVYGDYRTAGGDPCVSAEYRIRYKLVAVNLSRDSQPGCAGARGVTVSFPSGTCAYLTSPAAGFAAGDGIYTALAGGACSLLLKMPPANPRITIAGFVPDPVSPQAGDVNILFANAHYGESGVTFSSFAVSLVDAPAAKPVGTNITKLGYSGTALLQTYVNGRLNTKLDRTFGPFSLDFDVRLP